MKSEKIVTDAEKNPERNDSYYLVVTKERGIDI
jgi:hypothetical protein